MSKLELRRYGDSTVIAPEFVLQPLKNKLKLIP